MPLETVLQDFRYGFRQLRKRPLLIAVAVLSLALGIGANTAIFTLIDAVMLQSLPVHDPGRLVLFYDGISTGVYDGDTPQSSIFSYASWQYFRARNNSFENLCAFRQSNDRVLMHVSGAADTGPREQANVHLVSGNYFEVLGVNPAAGRVLTPDDDKLTAPRVAVISYRFWQNHFHLSSGTIGTSVVLNGTAFMIIGVAAQEFFGERVQTPPDFWIPLVWQGPILQRESWLDARDVYWLNMLGRLKPGATLRSAEGEINIRLHQFYTDQFGAHLSADKRRELQSVRVALKPGGAGISGLRFLYSEPLHVLMAVVAVVLLIASANIAILLLARASGRRQEFLARIALGASPVRLVRQVLAESVLLSLVGGLVGVVFAWWSVRGLILLLHVNSVVKVSPDPAVLAFTVGISVVTGLFFGIFPAVRCARIEPRSGTGARASEFGTGRLRTARVLIAGQVALSLALLLATGLLARSFMAMEQQDLGFQRQNLLLVRTDPRLAGYQANELYPLYRQIDERMNRIPGVVSASIARYTPESGSSSSSNFAIQGYTPPAGIKMGLNTVEVGPRFFETLRMPLLLGRTIAQTDTPASTPVAVVNQSFVMTYFPNRNPIGQRISLGSPFKAPGSEIIGVVADSRYYDLREKAKPMAFFSLWQTQAFPSHISEFYAGDLILRTSRDPSRLAAEVRRTLAGISSKLPFLGSTTLDREIEHSLDQQKMITQLCSIFGVLALVLAATGIYGTLAYSVAQRTREIGIRMAIGAQRANVLWMVLRDSLLVIAAGLVVGLPLALAGTRWLKSFLFGVGAADPIALTAAILLIGLIGPLAGYVPARRATKIDPMSALRYE